ncbi:FKBP-type peptidyl-prolyl cis-trans isomerase [Hymenobacter rubripertinctus]|uniref:Peptidyl-prolyl cis-trans isomerase n=1 Tax=Hymenobacter rubripertinctus TaxID=2029981 RepID=A0A418QIP2_9BACT|nr:FKBP-type peptidyl-prolyl cis-trans isomerase [Hymenobacter rubripertinctus]RIY05031.1 FKBP-type peptidyl-prolyl cis-trans isomerase [Hymenobacter rubripertinctus]
MNLDGLKEQISYIIGRDMARNFAQQGLDVDVDVFAQSMKEAGAGEPSRLTPEQMQSAMQQLQEQLGGGADQDDDDDTSNSNDMSNNKAEGEAFLQENANKAGVTTLASGLQYEVLTEGTGPKPGPGASVTTHYHGTLINGTVFDSSYQRGQPATFGVNQVIAGWTEALQLMPEGSKWRLYIPSDLAYGKRGAGRDIGPDTALIFDVELLKVNK